MKAKIFDDLRKSAKVTKIRIARDAGEDTYETRKFCKAHLHAMVNYVNGLKFKNKKPLFKFNDILAKIMTVPGLLFKISKFQDSYEEVLKWNELINDKKLEFSMTVRHREVDIATYNYILDICEKIDVKLRNAISVYFYHYARRNG